MKVTFNDESLKRHKVTREQCLEVIYDPMTRDFDHRASLRGCTCRMFVGYSQDGTLLEVGVEYLSESRMRIFHANRANARNRRRYENR